MCKLTGIAVCEAILELHGLKQQFSNLAYTFVEGVR